MLLVEKKIGTMVIQMLAKMCITFLVTSNAIQHCLEGVPLPLTDTMSTLGIEPGTYRP